VTTIAVALITSLFIVVIIYVVRILSDFRYISGVVRKETDLLADDIEEIRQEVKQKGVFGGLHNMVSWLFTNLGKRSSEKKTGKASKKSKK
jgi:hypothetical protein